VGLGWRPELSGDLLAHPDAASFLEVTAEALGTRQSLREASALSEAWPVVVHGVTASLGSADGLDVERTRRLAEVARRVRAPFVSEHVAFVRAGGVSIGHLTGLPFTREAVGVVARNVARARRLLPDVPLLLENVAWSFRWAEDAMDEGDFHAEVAAATGCDLLLDIANLYANARNAGRDAAELLARYPLERVAMMHVAGGVLDRGFYYDTHAHPVPAAVIDLAARVFAVAPEVPICIERDTAFPPFEELLAEIASLASLAPGEAPRSASTDREAHHADSTSRGDGRPPLADVQRALAVRLTSSDPEPDAGVARARSILERKRADEALKLLPRFAVHGSAAAAFAWACLEGRPRPRCRVAAADALRIAEAAASDAVFGHAARSDRLFLRTRFAPSADGARARIEPFAASLRAADGVEGWVIKGPGANARVRVIERSAEERPPTRRGGR
jgi:uncharacterized protein (UPF0276 family)